MILSKPGTLSRVLRLPLIVAALLAPALAAPAFADVPPNLQWNKYRLPPDYSTHGAGMDSLYTLILWITMIVFIVVEVVLVYFLIKYRHRPGQQKARFSHGNTRLEMVWTLVPAVILVALALMTKRVWDNYRYSPLGDDPNRARFLVVGEQFKWHVVYAGPDGKLGKYLAFPKPTDPGYRTMPEAEALKAITNAIAPPNNTLGQDLSAEEAGKDDDYAPTAAARPIVLPVDRALEINLSAKDVLHDFFLPNFRVKLDAVPGMRGVINFKALPNGQSTQRMDIDQIPAWARIWVTYDTPGARLLGNPKIWQISDPKGTGALPSAWIATFQSLEDGARNRLRRRNIEMEAITPPMLSSEIESLRSDLRSAYGITQLTALMKPWELACEELCGAGHYTMRNDVFFVSKQEYEDFMNKVELSKRAPSTQPIKPAPVAAGDLQAASASR